MAPIDWMLPAHMPHVMYGPHAQQQAHNATTTTIHDPRGSFVAPTITRGKSMFSALGNAITRSWGQGQYQHQHQHQHQHQGLPLVARGGEPTPGTTQFDFSKEKNPSTKPMIILLCILGLGVMFYVFFLDLYRKTPVCQRIAANTCNGVGNAFWAISHPRHFFHRSHSKQVAAVAATCAPPKTADSVEKGQAAGLSTSSGTVTPSSNENGNGNGSASGSGKGKENASPSVFPVSESAAPTMVNGDGGGDDSSSHLSLAPPAPSYHSTPAAGNTLNGGEGSRSLH